MGGALALFPVQTLWTTPVESEVAGNPVVDARHAYVRVGEATIAAYDLQSGERRWTIASGATPLAAGNDRVFAGDAAGLHAFAAGDGAASWSTPLDAPLAGQPTWANGWLVAGTTTGRIVALRAVDGSLLWEQTLDEPLHARPVIAGDRLVLPLTRGLAAVRLSTGEPVWRVRMGGPASEPLAAQDRFYVGSEDDHFYAVDAATGRTEWRVRTGADVLGPAAADERRVYFVSLDNVLRAVDLGSGNQRWRRPLPLRPSTGPLRVGETLVVAGLGSMLRAYAASNGAPAGEFAATGDLVFPAIAVRDAPLPAVLLVARDIAKGDTLLAIGRSVEPAIQPVAPLPNPVLLDPAAATVPPAGDAAGPPAP